MLFVQNVLLSIILIFILVLSFLNRTRHNPSFVGFWIKGPMFPFFYASKFSVLSPCPSPKHATFAQTKTLDEARRGANLLFPPILSFVPNQDPQFFFDFVFMYTSFHFHVKQRKSPIFLHFCGNVIFPSLFWTYFRVALGPKKSQATSALPSWRLSTEGLGLTAYPSFP